MLGHDGDEMAQRLEHRLLHEFVSGFDSALKPNSSRNNSPTVFVIVRNILCDLMLRNTSGITIAHARFTVHGAFYHRPIIALPPSS